MQNGLSYKPDVLASGGAIAKPFNPTSHLPSAPAFGLSPILRLARRIGGVTGSFGKTKQPTISLPSQASMRLK